MIIALFGGDGRALGTYAAVLIARAAASVGIVTTLSRVAETDESGLTCLDKVPDGLRVVEVSRDGQSYLADLRRETDAVPGGHLAVLDLPRSWLAACPVDLAGQPRILVVGPSALERAIAASALGRPLDGPLPWLLACGGASARSFGRRMRETTTAARLSFPASRIIPCKLPAPADGTAARPGTTSDALSMRAALRVLDIVAPGMHGMTGSPVDAIAPGPDEIDSRTSQERLRDLAEALDAAEDGDYPPSDELAAAPVLDEWELGVRPVAALVGRVAGHSGFPHAQRIRTSEVYASDRRTWARTYSRLYRLGRPAGPRPSLQ